MRRWITRLAKARTHIREAVIHVYVGTNNINKQKTRERGKKKNTLKLRTRIVERRRKQKTKKENNRFAATKTNKKTWSTGGKNNDKKKNNSNNCLGKKKRFFSLSLSLFLLNYIDLCFARARCPRCGSVSFVWYLRWRESKDRRRYFFFFALCVPFGGNKELISLTTKPLL